MILKNPFFKDLKTSAQKQEAWFKFSVSLSALLSLIKISITFISSGLNLDYDVWLFVLLFIFFYLFYLFIILSFYWQYLIINIPFLFFGITITAPPLIWGYTEGFFTLMPLFIAGFIVWFILNKMNLQLKILHIFIYLMFIIIIVCIIMAGAFGQLKLLFNAIFPFSPIP